MRKHVQSKYWIQRIILESATFNILYTVLSIKIMIVCTFKCGRRSNNALYVTLSYFCSCVAPSSPKNAASLVWLVRYTVPRYCSTPTTIYCSFDRACVIYPQHTAPCPSPPRHGQREFFYKTIINSFLSNNYY